MEWLKLAVKSTVFYDLYRREPTWYRDTPVTNRRTQDPFPLFFFSEPLLVTLTSRFEVLGVFLLIFGLCFVGLNNPVSLDDIGLELKVERFTL